MPLKQNLRAAMQAQALSLTDLARFSGVPKQTLNDWLAGTSPRNLEHLKSVAGVLKVTVDALISHQSEKQTDVADVLDGARWTHGLFEIRFRRVRTTKKSSGGEE